jgi:hypothetical protein
MKNKFIAIFAGLTMLASITAVSAAEAVNGEVAGNYPDGIKFVLNAESTETNKIVDIYYFGAELSDLSSYSFKVSVPGDVTPAYTQVFDGSITDESAAGLLNIVETNIATTAWGADKKIGSFTMATAKGHGELKVELTELDMYASNFDPDTYAGNVYYDGTGEFDNGDASWLVIPAWKTAVTKDATPVATYTDGEDYDVQTFTANIAAADVAKTLTWTVYANGQSKSDTANIDTEFGGNIEEVVIGLIVQGPSAASATATITVE